MKKKIIALREIEKNLNIDFDELRRITGFKTWGKGLEDFKIFESDRGNNKSCCAYEDDIEGILLYKIYKNSFTPTKYFTNLDIAKKFKKDYKELGTYKILNEIERRFKGVINHFEELDKTVELSKKYEIGKEIILLMNGGKHVITEENVEINNKTYISIMEDKKRKSLKLTPDCIQEQVIKKYETVFTEYFENKIHNSFSCYNIQSQMERETSDYNIDKESYNTKLLKPHKSYFMFLEEKILEATGSDLRDRDKMNKIKKEFIEKSKCLFYEKLDAMKNTIENIEFKNIYKSLDQICKNRKKFTEQQKKFVEIQSYEHNFFPIFIEIDEVLEFYNSKDGKLLNEYFKIHNFLEEMIKYFNHSIGQTSISKSIISIKNNFTKDMAPALKCLGYDYYFNYHLLHDAYQILGDSDLLEEVNLDEEKMINIIRQMISHGSFYINSRYGGRTLFKRAIETNNPKAVQILSGYIENVNKKELLTACFDYIDTEKMMIPAIGCIRDNYEKAFYQALYEGDYQHIDFLYEYEKVSLFKEQNSIEVYLCIKGQNSDKTFEVILKHLKKNYSTRIVEILKNNFLETAALWGNRPILYANLSYLKDLPIDNGILNKVLIYCLGKNVIDIFKELYSNKIFDPNRILFKFLIEGNLIMSEVDKETWDFMFKEPFKNIDVNKKVDGLSNPRYDHEKTIAGRAKERLHFSIKNKIFLEKLLNESEIFTDAFKSVLKSLNKNSLGSYICYMGFPSNKEIHPSLKQY